MVILSDSFSRVGRLGRKAYLIVKDDALRIRDVSADEGFRTLKSFSKTIVTNSEIGINPVNRAIYCADHESNIWCVTPDADAQILIRADGLGERARHPRILWTFRYSPNTHSLYFFMTTGGQPVTGGLGQYQSGFWDRMATRILYALGRRGIFRVQMKNWKSYLCCLPLDGGELRKRKVDWPLGIALQLFDGTFYSVEENPDGSFVRGWKIEGGKEMRIDIPSGYRECALSPDGTRLLLYGGNEYHVGICSLASGEVTPLPVNCRMPNWIGNCAIQYIHGENRLAMYSVDTGNCEFLFHASGRPGAPFINTFDDSFACSPTVSDDGRLLHWNYRVTDETGAHRLGSVVADMEAREYVELSGYYHNAAWIL